MRSAFNIRPKARPGAFENVNVHPFIAKILGLKLLEKLDGSFSMLELLYVP
jgi:hypothetical protein